MQSPRISMQKSVTIVFGLIVILWANSPSSFIGQRNNLEHICWKELRNDIGWKKFSKFTEVILSVSTLFHGQKKRQIGSNFKNQLTSHCDFVSEPSISLLLPPTRLLQRKVHSMLPSREKGHSPLLHHQWPRYIYTFHHDDV